VCICLLKHSLLSFEANIMGGGCSSRSAVKVTPVQQPGKAENGFDNSSASSVVPSQRQQDYPISQEPEDEPSHNNNEAGSTYSPGASSQNLGWNRNGKQSQRVRRQGGSSLKPGDAAFWDEKSQNSEISAEQRRFLCKILQKHFLFAGLEDDERDTVIGFMIPQNTLNGEVVCSQGETGDCCYFIQSGTFTVTIDDRSVNHLRSKHSFGELAMLYNVKRTGTVTCSQEGTLWKMDGHCFRMCMEKLSNKHMQRAMDFLNKDVQFCALKEDTARGLLQVAMCRCILEERSSFEKEKRVTGCLL